MGGSKTKSTSAASQACTNEDSFKNNNFNSLVEDAHVNEQAKYSQDVFLEAVKKAKSMNLDEMRIRGLKLDYKSPDEKERFCRIEVLCQSEKGIIQFMELCRKFKGSMTFTYVRIMGDPENNRSASYEIPIC